MCPTNQVKALTLDETLDFHINLVGEKRIIIDVLDKAMKNNLIKNNLEEANDHALTSRVDEDKCTQVRDDVSISRSSTSESVRLRWRLRFQEKE